jgi:aminopeptidase N
MAWDDHTPFLAGLTPAGEASVYRIPGATVYHIDFEIADDLQSLTGREAVLYINQEDTPLNEIYFRLFPILNGGDTQISGARVNGEDATTQLESQDSALKVSLPAPLEPGESVMVDLDFTVTIPHEMGGNYGLFGYFDKMLVLDTFYPAIPVYDDDGWHKNVTPPNGDTTYQDASLYIVRVTAPDDLVMAAAGVSLGAEKSRGTQTITYAAGPARDFYLVASENYEVASEKSGGTTVNSYYLKGEDEHGDMALQFSINAINKFNERFGPFPYAEFDVVATPMLALGIEYPGIVGINFNLYDPLNRDYGLATSILLETVVAHEVAHQWFYNMVGNDQNNDPWLDEAISQYATGLYYDDMYGSNAARSYKNSWSDSWGRVDKAEIPIGLPAGDYTQEEYGPIVYGRGPLFIQALEEEMGIGVFDDMMKDYYNTYLWEISTPQAFQELAEEHCECDLQPLFDEWVYE